MQMSLVSLRPLFYPIVMSGALLAPLAFTVARHQEAKYLELQAATSLAQLWQQQGKRAEARAASADLRLGHRGL